MIETGCMLGEWIDKLGKDDYINKWISTGPKSYGYLTSLEKEVVKIKGFTLNYENLKILKLKTMKKIIRNEIDKVKLQNDN